MGAMSTSHPHLLSPLAVGPLTLRNRLVMGSMHTGLEDRSRHLPELTAYFVDRARGGAAGIQKRTCHINMVLAEKE